MIDTNEARLLDVGAIGLQHRQVGKREPVVFVVIGEECQCGVLMLDLGVKHNLIPIQHLLEAASPINDVYESLGTNTGHDDSFVL
jgi:hypothetical protein